MIDHRQYAGIGAPRSDALSRRELGMVTLAIAAASLIPAAAQGAAQTLPTSRNIAMVREIVERGFNRGDLSVADQYCAQHYTEHEYLAPTNLSGPDTMRALIRETRKAVQQFTLTIEDLVERDGKVWTRGTCRGIDSRSGKPIVIDVIDIYRFENGKLVEHWGVPDRFAMLMQTGMLPKQ